MSAASAAVAVVGQRPAFSSMVVLHNLGLGLVLAPKLGNVWFLEAGHQQVVVVVEVAEICWCSEYLEERHWLTMVLSLSC